MESAYIAYLDLLRAECENNKLTYNRANQTKSEMSISFMQHKKHFI